MPNCEITDKVGYWSAAGTFIGVQSAIIYAIPDLSSRRYDDGAGAYRTLGVNPNITTATFQLGRQATTDSTGSFTLQLPYAIASTHPSASPTPQWTIALPDGKLLTGTVPDMAGPFTLDDLATANDTGVPAWAWANQVYVAPVTAGVLARGIATFTAQQSAIILFTTPFSGAYEVFLSASADTVTGQIPSVAYISKSSSGFTIKATEQFTGEVSWKAEQ